ncbi:DUF1206 domain-containing protein [Streptomyces goshikiensis]|uniref:DUF1206 domain-containing protein n=1 Tax=Streptomyces goshikiensis TaxID=1942 RepID=UPI00371C0412
MATGKDAARAERPGQGVADSRAMEVASRVGLCARGVIYVLVGLLAVRIGFGGGSGKEADRSGAVRTIGEQPSGQVLLWALVVGLAAMALWRLSEPHSGRRRQAVTSGPGAWAPWGWPSSTW